MLRTPRRGSPPARLARVVLPLLLLALVAAVAAPAAASRPAEVIVLPGATSAEGIAAGRGATFYAGDLFAGDIFRGNVRRGTAELFIDAPAGRQAVGMAADLRHDLLFVAGGFTGQGYVYDLGTGATRGQLPVRDATGHDHQRRGRDPSGRLVHRFAASPAVLRAGQPGRGPGTVPHPWA